MTDFPYDSVLFDLDGTLIRGSVEVPHARDAVARLRGAGTTLAVVTNNASRAPEDVAAQLVAAGFEVGPEQIVTSAQAGARVLADLVEPGAEVLVVGTAALIAEVESVGLRAVREAGTGTVAVVQGHSPDTCWRDLAQACLAIRAGAVWVACNRDATLPTDAGELPGNGSMVAALVTATGRTPTVAGKPGRPLIDVAAARCDSKSPLLVGDRLDTDIAGAVATGHDSLLVFTGVTRPAELLAAGPRARPTYLGEDLTVLADLETARLAPRGGWSAQVAAGTLTLSGTGDPWDALRTLGAALTSTPSGGVRLVADGEAAADAARTLGLPETVEIAADTVDPSDPVREAHR